MRKHLLSLAGAAFLVTTLAQCASAPKPAPYPAPVQQNTGNSGGQPIGNIVPEWYLSPEMFIEEKYGSEASYFYGTGQSSKNIASLAKQTADSRARDEVARQVGIEVKNRIQDYMAQSGVTGENPGSLEFTESVSKQIAGASLVGAKTIKRAVSPDGKTYFSLVVYSLNDAQKLAAQAVAQVKGNYKGNEEALFNEWKAKKAFDDLDGEDFTGKMKAIGGANPAQD